MKRLKRLYESYEKKSPGTSLVRVGFERYGRVIFFRVVSVVTIFFSPVGPCKNVAKIRKPTTSPSTAPSGRASASRRPAASPGAMAEQCPAPRPPWKGWNMVDLTASSMWEIWRFHENLWGCNNETTGVQPDNGFEWI